MTRRFAIHIAVMTICVNFACSAQSQVNAQKARSIADEYELEVLARGDLIEREIVERGEDHPWAGTYYERIGRGHNIGGMTKIVLSPTGSYAYQQHGCLGILNVHHGTVHVSDDGLLQMQPDDPSGRVALWLKAPLEVVVENGITELRPKFNRGSGFAVPIRFVRGQTPPPGREFDTIETTVAGIEEALGGEFPSRRRFRTLLLSVPQDVSNLMMGHDRVSVMRTDSPAWCLDAQVYQPPSASVKYIRITEWVDESSSVVDLLPKGTSITIAPTGGCADTEDDL